MRRVVAGGTVIHPISERMEKVDLLIEEACPKDEVPCQKPITQINTNKVRKNILRIFPTIFLADSLLMIMPGFLSTVAYIAKL